MLPKNLLYQNKLAAAPAQAYSTLISPTSGNGPYSFNGTSSTIIINIPTGGNRVLNPADTYLKFQVKLTKDATDATYVRFGCAGAHGIFQRLRLFHTGIIEDVDDYGLLASKMIVHTCPGDSFSGRQNVMLGLSTETAVTNAVAGTGFIAAPTGMRWMPTNANNQLTVTFTNTTSVTQTFCISLLSIIGTLTDKYLPLFEMGAAPLRLELTTVNSALKALNSQAGAFTTAEITNVELNCAFIDLSDMTIAQLRGSRGGLPIQMVIPSYRTYVQTQNITSTATAATLALGNTGSSTPYTITIPARFSSLKSLFVVMQDKPNGANTFYANATAHFNLAEYSFRVGSQIFPAKRPASYSEFLSELSKALGSQSDWSAQGLINENTWTNKYSSSNVNTVSGQNAGITLPNLETAVASSPNSKEQAFMIGIDLESYSNSDRSSIYTGFNTLTTDIQFNPLHCAVYDAAAGTIPVKYTTFALFDQVLTFENGVATPTF